MSNDLDYRIWSYYWYSYKLAKKFLRCSDEASDVASETMFRILKVIRSKNPPEIRINPEPYVKKTTINLIKNAKRRRKKYVSLEKINHRFTYKLNFDLYDLNTILLSCDDDVVKLTNMKIEGYNTKECSEELNVSENSLKVKWHRTKKKLIQEMKK